VDACVDLVVDPFQNAYLVGHFRGTSTIGTNSITSTGNSDVLLVSYGPNGGERWVWTAGGASPDFGLACALDRNLRLYLAGSYSATATFGGSSVTSPDILQKAFLARLDLAPTLTISFDSSEVHLSWPTNFSQFTLQTASTLNPRDWSESGASPRVVARDYVVSTNTVAASQLFRLRGP
jgi:hypothetical protein